MFKQLPRVSISQQDYEFVEDTCRQLLSEARHLAHDGTALYYPGGIYEACWTRDFCYMVEGAGHLLPPEEVLAGIDYLLAGQDEEGTIPDRVRADGVPIYLPGPDEAPLADLPPTDNAQFMVKLVDAYVHRTHDVPAFLERRGRLYEAMDHVPRGEEGLVVIDPNRPRSPYGFTDTVAKSGKVFFSSLLYWEACRRLAALCAEAEYHDEAHDWYEQAELLQRNLDQFYDEEYALYRAASRDCNQLDLWGSVYAGAIKFLSNNKTRRIGQFLVEAPDVSIWRGHLRHLPVGEYWERLLMPVAPDTYQNGGFWAVPSGWTAQVIATYDEAAARSFLAELLELWRTEEVYEWISPYASPAVPGYVASATNVLGAIKADPRL